MGIEALVFDCGGVLDFPTTGDWLLPPGFERILGDGFAPARLPEFRRVRAEHAALLPDCNKIATEEEECALFCQYFRAVFSDMGLALSRDDIASFARMQTYQTDRHELFGDVLPYLEKWRARYKLGIVSDAPPSTRRFLSENGVLAMIVGATFSCDIGITKPNRAVYERTLSLLGVQAGSALFIDDYPSRLHGARAVGMRAVQMRREMPSGFAMPPEWTDGPVVHSFEALDRALNVHGDEDSYWRAEKPASR